MSSENQFIVATPGRSVCDDNARALFHAHALRFIALGTRRGTAGVPPSHTRLFPTVGLLAYAGAALLDSFRAEVFRCSLLPLFDRWVRKKLKPGDHLISSYGYANESFKWVREHGGKTFVDAGNSHPEHYWKIVSEEHARWNCALPPFPRNWYQRAIEMMPLVDYVLSPSSYVTRTFLDRGFKPAQILRNIYPLNLEYFTPPSAPRPDDRPLTIISTGAPSLRKGAPYLLEAYEIILRRHRTARLLLTGPPHASLDFVMSRFRHLPIEWGPSLPHVQLAERLRGADIFVLPSLEDGFARTVTEAMACGLPVILTPNTGAADLVQPGVSGEIVPIRDAQAIAAAIIKWADRIMAPGSQVHVRFDARAVAFETFEREFLAQLASLGLLSKTAQENAAARS